MGEIRVSAGLRSFWKLQEKICFQAFSSLQKPPAFLHYAYFIFSGIRTS